MNKEEIEAALLKRSDDKPRKAKGKAAKAHEQEYVAFKIAATDRINRRCGKGRRR